MLYRKVEKGYEDYYGLQPVEGNPFMDKPCFLCLAAQHTLRYNAGVLRAGMQYARMRTSKEDATGILPQDSDIEFLTYDRGNDKIETLFNDYILPIIQSTDDINKLSKLFRNINLMTYCDATREANKLFALIEKALQEKGFSQEEVQNVMKNIVCISLSIPIPVHENVTSFVVMDIEDMEGGIPSEEYREAVRTSPLMDKAVMLHNKNRNALLIQRDEKHTPEYFNKGEVATVCVPTIVTAVLENARKNQTSQELIPLDTESIVEETKLVMEEVSDGRKTSKSVLESLDASLYDGIRRASKGELSLTILLDKVSKTLSSVHLTDYKKVSRFYKSEFEKFMSFIKKSVSKEQLDYILNGGDVSQLPPKEDTKISSESERRINEMLDENFGTININGVSQIDVSSLDDYSLEGQPPEVVRIAKLIEDMIRRKRSEIDEANQDISDYKTQRQVTSEIIQRIKEIVPSHIYLEALFRTVPYLGLQCSCYFDQDPNATRIIEQIEKDQEKEV